MSEPQHKTSPSNGQEPQLLQVRDAVCEALKDAPSAQMDLNDVSELLRSRLPGFRPNVFGCAKLSSLLSRKLGDVVELQLDKRTNTTTVRLVSAAPASSDEPEEAPADPKPSTDAEQTAYPIERVRQAALDALSQAPGKKLDLSQLGSSLNDSLPGWSPSHYGSARLSSFLSRQLSELVSLRKGEKQSVCAELRVTGQTDKGASDQPPVDEALRAVEELLSAEPDGRMHLSRLADRLKDRLPGFRPKLYGCSCLSTFLTRRMAGAVTLQRDKQRNNFYALLRKNAAPAPEPSQPAPAQPKSEPQKRTSTRSARSASKALQRASTERSGSWALKNFAAISDDQYRRLAGMALPEPWEFHDDELPLSILKEYVRATFARVKRLGGLGFDRKKEIAAFNTGLLDRNCEPIFAYFGRKSESWELLDFCLPGQGQYGKPLLKNFSPLPPRAVFSRSADELIYDLSAGEPQVDWNHVLVDKISRIPGEVLRLVGLDVPNGAPFIQDLSVVRSCRRELRTNPLTHRRLKSIFEGAIDNVMKRLQYDYRLAVPIYRISRQTLGLALPLDLTSSSRVDLALICERIGSVGYQGHTIYPLRWVYRSARVMFRPTVPWLDPLTLPPAPVLQDDESQKDSQPQQTLRLSRRKGRGGARSPRAAAQPVKSERENAPKETCSVLDQSPRANSALSMLWNLFRRKK